MAKKISKALRATAYHEAGHAVMHWVLRRGMKEASIISDPERGSAGHVCATHIPVSDPNDYFAQDRFRKYAEREVLILMAGREAEAKYQGWNNHRGARQDTRLAHEVVSWISRGDFWEDAAYVEWLRRRSNTMICGRMYWPFVVSVAGALLKSKRLTGREIRAVIKQHIANENTKFAEKFKAVASK